MGRLAQYALAGCLLTLVVSGVLYGQALPPAPSLAGTNAFTGSNTFSPGINVGRAGVTTDGGVVGQSFTATQTDGGAGVNVAGQKMCLDSACAMYLKVTSGEVYLYGSRFVVIDSNKGGYFNGNTDFLGWAAIQGNIFNDAASGQIKLNDVDGACVGNGTGTDCDGALSTGTLKMGLTGTSVASSQRGTGTLDFASALVSACSADLTITVTGAVAGTEVALGVPNGSAAAGSVFYAWVSATDTVSVRHCCGAGASCDPASGTFVARVFNP